MSVRIQRDDDGKVEVVVSGNNITSYDPTEDCDEPPYTRGVVLWGDDVLAAIEQAAAQIEEDAE